MVKSIVSAIALDLGTTSIKAGLLDQEGDLSSIVAQPAPEITVSGGRYESDALAYAETAERVLGECLAQAGCSPPLGLCSQRSSFLIWERASGQPLTPLISWQDNRGAASCEALRNSEGLIRDLTGLRLTQYYFAPKLRVVLQDHPEWRARLERGELLVGTLDTFLIWRWTGGKHHVTDASMAARTLLMDIRLQRWSPALCELFGIPVSILPRITPSSGLNLRLCNDLTLQASLGDQSAALIASVGESRSEVLVNLGTGGFVVRYLSESDLAESAAVQDGYLRTLVFQDRRLHTHIAIEGTLNSLAAALAPYPVGECRIEDLAREDIFCIAEPSGLGAPYFRSDLGIRFSRSVEHLTPGQIACLLLEGIIFRVARILEDFHSASAIQRVYLTGGLSELICFQQGIALCAPCDVYRLQQKDSSLQGAALLAARMASTHPMKADKDDAKKIEITHNESSLPEKYLRWKDWFNALLDLS
jgi:glycerol kinase